MASLDNIPGTDVEDIEEQEMPQGPSIDLDDDLLGAEEEEAFTEEDLADLPLFDDMDDDNADDVHPPMPDMGEEMGGNIVEKEVKAPKPEEDGKNERVRKALDRFRALPPKKKILFFAGLGTLLIVLSASMILLSGDAAEPVAPEPPPETVVVAETPVETPASAEVVKTVEAPENARTFASHQSAGMELFRQGRYPEAIEAFESDISSSYLFLARCYQILGENEEALARYQRVLYEYPDRNAFVEVFSLAEEMFAGGDYWTARKLYYSFIAHMDQMPGSVKKMVPRAYFQICRTFEEEAIGLLKGNAMDVYSGPEWGRARPLTMAPEMGGGEASKSWSFRPPFRITVDAKRVNEFLTLFSLECVGAPAFEVLKGLSAKAGYELELEDGAQKRLEGELVSAFLKERQLEEILEYITGQVGMAYSLDDGKLMVQALENRIQGEWLNMKEEAITAFRRSLYRFLGHEDAPKAYFEISRLHYLSGDFDSAISPAKTLITEYPEYSQVPMALLNVSNCYMELGDFKKARQHLSELVNKYTNHPSAQEGYLLLARCWWKEGNPAAAELTLRSLNERFPHSDLRYEGTAVLGRIFASLGKYKEVARLLSAIRIDEVPSEETAVSLLLLKAEAQLRSGDEKSAVDSAVKMLETHPENMRAPDALYILAEAYFALEEYFLSFASCKSLKENHPAYRTDPNLYIVAARSLNRLGLNDLALTWLDEGLARCVEGTRDAYTMYMLLGDVLYECKKFERAKVVYRKSMEHMDFEKEAGLHYVKALMAQQDFGGALASIRGQIERWKDDAVLQADLYKLAGDCYNAQGDPDAAIAAFQGELKDEEGR